MICRVEVQLSVAIQHKMCQMINCYMQLSDVGPQIPSIIKALHDMRSIALETKVQFSCEKTSVRKQSEKVPFLYEGRKE